MFVLLAQVDSKGSRDEHGAQGADTQVTKMTPFNQLKAILRNEAARTRPDGLQCARKNRKSTSIV